MSKAIKDMLVDDLKHRLREVGDVIVVSLGKLDAQKTTALRQSLRKKQIHLQLVKNSLARRATAGTPLEPAMEDAAGMLALAWGGEDVVENPLGIGCEQDVHRRQPTLRHFARRCPQVQRRWLTVRPAM